MLGMFNECNSATSINVSSFNTSNVTDMSYMFDTCTKLTTLNVSNFNTSNVTNMFCMFNCALALTSLDLGSFNTAKVTNMQNMFNSCTGLNSLTIPAGFVSGSAVTSTTEKPLATFPSQLTHTLNANGTASAIVSGSTDINSASAKTTYVNPVTVTFYSGSTVLGTQVLPKGVAQNLSTGAQGSVSGYSFYGWATSGSTATRTYTSGQSVTITGNTNLYAIYSRTITFKSGLNQATTNTVTQYYYGGAAKTITTPSAASLSTYGYSFIGWYYSSGTSSGLTINTTSTTSTTPAYTTYYAKYRRTITVNYNGNGASGTTTASTAYQYYNSYGTARSTPSVTLASENYTDPSGYSFYQWGTSSTATSGTAADAVYQGYNPAYNATTYSTTLYAIWTRSITFYSGTAKGTTNSVTQYYRSGASAVTSPAITAPNTSWTAYGWWTGTTASYSRNVAASTSFTPTATAYYATFSRTVTVNYGANGGSGSTTASTGTQYYNSYGAISTPSITLASNGFTAPAGKKFYQWGTATSSTSGYSAGAAYTALSPAVGTTSLSTTLYAIWQNASYTVTYNKNSGSITNEGNYTSYTYGTGLTLPTPSRSGYYFAGWYESSDFSGSKVTTISATATGNKTYYAKWLAVLSVPAQSGTLTYSGSAQSPSWNSNYDSGKLTLGGTTSGTNATSYNATFTPKSGYCWSDGSTAAKTVSWSIGKAAPTYTAPTAKSLTYNGTTNTNGTAQVLLNAGSTSHGTIQYSSDNSTWSTTIPSQTNAGTYTIYWKLVGDSNLNNVNSTSISVTIARKGINRVTASSTALRYSGKKVIPGWNNYSADTSTIGGAATSQGVGSYSTTFTPMSNFQWSSGSNVTGAITISWSVTNDTFTITYYKNDGNIANESSYTSYTYGTGLTLPTPSRAFYSFGGWYENSSFNGTAVTAVSNTASGNKTYYAKWTPAYYNVTYRIDGMQYGEVDSVRSGTAFTARSVPADIPSGYKFSGWSNVPTVMPEQDITIEGSYVAMTFSVTVPAVLPVTVGADGTVTVASDAAIINGSEGAVKVTGMTVNAANGWTQDNTFNAAAVPVDSKVFAFYAQTDDDTDVVNQTIAANGNLALDYEADIPAQSGSIDGKTIANVIFTVAWAE